MKNLKDWDVEITLKDGTIENCKTSGIRYLRDMLYEEQIEVIPLADEILTIYQRWGLKNITSIKFTR